MMILANLIGVALLALPPGQPANPIPAPLAFSEAPATNWRMVLDADLILKVRVDSLTRPVPENPGYEEMTWSVLDVIKGNPKPSSVVHVLVYPSGPDAKATSFLRTLQSKEALVFLTSPGGPETSATYICDFAEAVQPFDPAIAKAIRLELQNQTEMATSVNKYLDTKELPLEAKVVALIQSLRSPASFQRPAEELDPVKASDGAFTFPRAIDHLEKLGPSALPAIIKHLNDLERLPGAPVRVELDIRHHAGAFEGIYHTHAYEMRDVLFFVLEELTGQAFGGGETTDEARDKAVRGWRLYLGHDPAFRRRLLKSATP